MEMEKVFFDKGNSSLECGVGGKCILTDLNLTAETDNCVHIGTNIAATKGKIYWETKILKNFRYGFVGIVGPKSSTNRRLLFRFFSNGAYTLNYSEVASALNNAVYNVKDIVGLALDTEKNSVMVSINGVQKGTINLIADQKIFYPAVGNAASYDNVGFKATANFGGTPFAYPIPKGYTSLAKPHRYIYLKENEAYGARQSQ